MSPPSREQIWMHCITCIGCQFHDFCIWLSWLAKIIKGLSYKPLFILSRDTSVWDRSVYLGLWHNWGYPWVVWPLWSCCFGPPIIVGPWFEWNSALDIHENHIWMVIVWQHWLIMATILLLQSMMLWVVLTWMMMTTTRMWLAQQRQPPILHIPIWGNRPVATPFKHASGMCNHFLLTTTTWWVIRIGTSHSLLEFCRIKNSCT